MEKCVYLLNPPRAALSQILSTSHLIADMQLSDQVTVTIMNFQQFHSEKIVYHVPHQHQPVMSHGLRPTPHCFSHSRSALWWDFSAGMSVITLPCPNCNKTVSARMGLFSHLRTHNLGWWKWSSSKAMDNTHLRQGGYVFGSICLFVFFYLSVYLLATLLKKSYEWIVTKFYGGVPCGRPKRNKWLGFGSDPDRGPTLVEVCTLQVLLISKFFSPSWRTIVNNIFPICHYPVC